MRLKLGDSTWTKYFTSCSNIHVPTQRYTSLLSRVCRIIFCGCNPSNIYIYIYVAAGNKRSFDLNNKKKLGRMVLNQQFGCKRSFRLRVDFQRLFQLKTPMDLTRLEDPFSVEEIKSAVFELGGDKAPVPDGFPIHFFKLF